MGIVAGGEKFAVPEEFVTELEQLVSKHGIDRALDVHDFLIAGMIANNLNDLANKVR